MDRHLITHKINTKFGGMAWIIFHEESDAIYAVDRINGVRNYTDENGYLGDVMTAKISTRATIVCQERNMSAWNIDRPRVAKFLISYPLAIHEGIDTGTVVFDPNDACCPFCERGYHKRINCPILWRCLNLVRQYECTRCLAINHHHTEQCKFSIIYGAANIEAERLRQQHGALVI